MLHQSATLEIPAPRPRSDAPKRLRARQKIVSDSGFFCLTATIHRSTIRIPSQMHDVAGICNYCFHRLDNSERRPKRYDCMQRGQRHHRRTYARAAIAQDRPPGNAPKSLRLRWMPRPRSTSFLTHTARPPVPFLSPARARLAVSFERLIFPLHH